VIAEEDVRHVEVAVASSRRADLARRLTGRFYTPPVIAERLANAAVRSAETVCDPFCGDGRLITAWLTSADRSSVRRVALYDYDADALATAVRRVRELLPNVAIDASAGDSFGRAIDRCDLVLTNPPWELLKPDTRDRVARRSYRDVLRGYAARLLERYPEAGGRGINLARAGALLAIECVRDGGHLGIVLPASLFADRASTEFRAALFRRLAVERIDSYPAEARVFAGVDQPFVTVSGVRGATSSFELRRHDAELAPTDDRRLTPGRPLPLTLGAAQCEIVEDLQRAHETLGALPGICLGRELDETRLGEAASPTGVPFVKGRQVFPFRVEPGELRIDPRKRPIPDSVRERRLAWRDVARPSLKRRMHVALVPDGHVTGNSLGIAYFPGGSRARLASLVAVMNSFVFEAQVRAELATAHISLGMVRRCAVPEFDRVATSPSPELEVAVARAYGLRRDAFATLLEAFAVDRDLYLRAELWR